MTDHDAAMRALGLPPGFIPESTGLTRKEAAWMGLITQAQLTEEHLRQAGVPHPERHHLALGEGDR